MRVLVAGGAGFIGSHVIDALLRDDCRVVCVDNLSRGGRGMIAHHLSNPHFTFYEQDICDEAGLDAIFARHPVDRVYHLAANSDIQKGGFDPAIDIRNTFQTTLCLLQAMLKWGVKQLLFSSTSAVYGDKRELLKEDAGDLRPVSYYGGAKLASEAFICAFAAMNDFRANILRFPNVVGPRLTHGAVFDFVSKLRRNPIELEILGDGQQEKPYLYVLDLVEAIVRMPYERDIGIYNVGVETATTVTRIADIVCAEMGLKNVRYRYTGGAVGWKGDVAKFQYDLSRIHALGWKAQYTSDEAIRLSVRSLISDRA